jgi:hypothetical protein
MFDLPKEVISALVGLGTDFKRIADSLESIKTSLSEMVPDLYSIRASMEEQKEYDRSQIEIHGSDNT